MTITAPANNRILQAIERLKAYDRRAAVAILNEELQNGPQTGDRWASVAQLCFNIGELAMSREAMRRYAATEPRTLNRILGYCADLARDGLTQEAMSILDGLPTELQVHPSVMHLSGTIATQIGDFARAEAIFRRSLTQFPSAPHSWSALSVIKSFGPGDPDIARMESLKGDVMRGPPKPAAQFCYALGKAYDDAGDPEHAFAMYSEGAAIMRGEEGHGTEADDVAARIIQDYTRGKLDLLRPSQCESRRMIFVNGLPRSGTTLVEQIVTSHSMVRDGAELNLLKAALIPAGNLSLPDALKYQAGNEAVMDPWGDVARDYLRMIDERFGPDGGIVDKTLNQSQMMGLLLHILPKAKVIWLRRRPEDCALSCFRTFFTAPVPWSWSAEDIAAHFKSEDALHRHWTEIFPNRILTVPYEALTTEPQAWIRRILAHLELDEEPQVFEAHRSKRSVTTASVAQVRQPISAARIGAAEAYTEFTVAFRHAYSA
jgi:tetratricopeptide (TPR) repeat protein